MPKTTTAERHHYVCPLCDQPLARDVDGKGWVRHTRRPGVPNLLADDAKRRMMTPEDVEFLRFIGLCPFERGEKDEVVTPPPPPRFAHLEPRPGSYFRQWFVAGRKIRVDVLYDATVGPEARTPDEVAVDFGIPLEAVHEAIEYCLHNLDVLRRDHATGEEQDFEGGPERPDARSSRDVDVVIGR